MVAEFTKSLSIVVFMALILSWFASVLVSPVLGYKIIENKAPKPESEWTKRDRIMHNLQCYILIINLKDCYIGL